jgi:hypothetical protein
VSALAHRPAAPGVPACAGREQEAAARRTLRAQIARLEAQLAELAARSRPCDALDWTTHAHGGPRLLGLGELERTRDALAERVHAVRAVHAERALREGRMRALRDRMLLDPGAHRFVRVTQEDVGEHGCGAWHVRPRLGLIGMLMGWWQVKLSSGCPLAEGR